MRTVAYPHPGEILKEEFLDAMGLTACRLSKAMNVPQTRIGGDSRGRAVHYG